MKKIILFICIITPTCIYADNKSNWKSIKKIVPDGVNVIRVINDKQGFVVYGNANSQKQFTVFKKLIEQEGLGFPYQRKMSYQYSGSEKKRSTHIKFELLISKTKKPEKSKLIYNKRPNEVAEKLSEKEWIQMVVRLETKILKAKYTNLNAKKLLIDGQYNRNKELSEFLHKIRKGGLGEPELTNISKGKFRVVLTR